VTATLPRLGELLVESGAITDAQLEAAIKRQRQQGGRLGTNLVELGFIDERALAKVLSEQLKIPAASASQLENVEPWVLALVPSELSQKHRAVPIREDGDRLWVAMADPTDRLALKELERASGKSVRPMVAPELLVQFALEHAYGVQRTPATPVHVPAPAGKLEVEDVNVVGERVVTPLVVHTGMMPEPAAQAVARVALRPARRGLAAVVSELASALSEGDVLEIAVKVIAQDAPRLLVLLAKDGQLATWHAVGIPSERLAGLRARVDQVPALDQPLRTGEPWVGTLAPDGLGALGALAPSQQVTIVLPLRRASKPIGCILGFDAAANARLHLGEYDQLARKLDHALCMTYYRRMLTEG
jgi:hypothetical protein